VGLDRVAAGAIEAAGTDIVAATDVGGRGSIELGQGAHEGGLGEQGIADFHHPEQGPVLVQPGAGDLQVGGRIAGMGSQADGRAATARQAALQLVGKEQVGQLALAVGAPTGILLLAVEISKVDRPTSVRHAADGDDAGIWRRQKWLKQQAGQGKVTQVVDAELQLETIDGLAIRGRHETSVVD